ncbi:hypothetical protein D9M71_436120 [compost metagenome]
MHVVDSRQGHQVVRLEARQGPEAVFAQDAVARLVTQACLELAPGAEFAQHGELGAG